MTAVLGPQLRESERAGANDVRRWREAPPVLPALPLARFEDSSVRGLLLRKLLLASCVPAQWLVPLDRLAGKRRKEYRQFLITFAYWQGVRRAASPAQWDRVLHPPIILMYHAIATAGEAASRYILPQDRFNLHLRWLRRLRRQVAPLAALVKARRSGSLPPPRSVVVTFDDGYRDNIFHALPMLEKHNCTATAFLVTGSLGGANKWDADGALAGRPLMSWEEARSAAASGRLAFGGHTRGHPVLPSLDDAHLRDQLVQCLADLQRELGPGSYPFAYPHGRFDARVKLAVESTGFDSAGCSLGGTNEPWIPLYELRRVEIKGTDGLAAFILAVLLGMRLTPRELIAKLVRGG